MSNPVLIELTRGGSVECVHTGSLAISRPNGETVLAMGNIAIPVFPRSAVKAFQAIPLIESGAADAFGFGSKELALACASHSGTPAHVATADGMLKSAGLPVSGLACGCHEPSNELAAKEMFARGEKPTQLHNNCSGKHAGMVATCKHCGDPVAGYLDINHPHQKRIAKAMHDFCGDGFKADRYGIDGCSAPNWAVPVRDLARAFAVLTSGEGLAPERRNTAERITAACMAHSDMVAGPGRLDTTVMTALPGKVFMKTGAEGVYCGGFPDLGVGFAMKIDDGNKRASQAVVEAIVNRLIPKSGAFGSLGPIKNWVGTVTGETRTASGLDAQLDKLRIAP
jgi:L-asparaginase II